MRIVATASAIDQPRARCSARLFTVMLGMGVSIAASAGPTTLSAGDASKGSSNVPVILPFALTRSGDLGYPLVLSYHTVDGSAVAGTDFSSASGIMTLPAGASVGTIPVTLSANTVSGANRDFQLQVDSATGTGPAISMATQVSFATGSAPAAAALADINGDGKPDLIVVNSGSDTVSILLDTTAPGATTPTFSTQQAFATGSSPDAVSVVDINGDGKLDVIVANKASNTISLLVNTTAPNATTPTFAAQQTFNVGTSPSAIATDDINGDGKPDVIVANRDDNSVSVLRNTTASASATVSFGSQLVLTTGSSPQSVRAADLNGDGKIDLIVANAGSNSVSVLFNTTVPTTPTSPSFAAQSVFGSGGLQAFSVSAQDINGDGRPDLIVTNAGSSNVAVLLNTTTPGAATPVFAAAATFATGSNPNVVYATDVNGDGKPDLVVANTSGNTLSVLLNITAVGASKPSFATQQTFATGANPQSVAIADLNGDGRPDVVAANGNGSSVSVLLNTTTLAVAAAAFGAQQTFSTGSSPTFVASGDFNGDGKPDLVTVNYGDNSISVLLNTTAIGSTTPTFAARHTFAVGANPYDIGVADLNGDGKPDLVITDYGANTISVLLNATATGAGTPVFATQQIFSTGNFTQSIAITDLNGDGKPDIVICAGGDNVVSVLLNTTVAGASTLGFAARQNFAAGTNPFFVTAADINGDGKADLIVANQGSANLSVLLNTSSGGTLGFAAQKTFAVAVHPVDVIVADINGDGKPDLISASGGVTVLLNTSTSSTTLSFAAGQDFPGGSGLNVHAVVTDMDGDGKPDLVLNDFNGAAALVLLNTTAPGAIAASFASALSYPANLGSYGAAVADVDNDGRPDIVLVNYNANNVSVLPNTQFRAALSGSPATGTIVHDYLFAAGFE